MPPVILAAVAISALALFLLTWAVLSGPDRAHQRTMDNLGRGLNSSAAGSEDGTSRDRSTSRLGILARRLTPPTLVRRLERLLARAGRPPAWPLDRVLAVKILLPVAAGAVTLLYISGTTGKLPVFLGLTVTGVAYFIPELLLHSRAQERSQKIALELADTLDQMSIAVEAGLGFDSAMARAGKNGNGPLAEELIRTLQDIQLGQSRRQAYESLAARTDVADLRRFIRSIVQADAYGIAIADVLRTQAGEMRLKRRQRAEEKAMQIPVKVIFPLMLFILPVLFIVLLGPAVIDMIAAFS